MNFAILRRILVVLVEQAFIKERAVRLDERDVDTDSGQLKS